MATLIVTYDLKKEPSERDYDGFHKCIKQYDWRQLSESCYAIDAKISPSSLYEALKPHIDQNDTVLVLTLAAPWAGQHVPRTRDFWRQQIPNS